jgi:radical SAM-linked protein
MNAWVRAFRRAKAPLSYSQGFHTHPKLNFATAPPVGEETEADYVDIVLKERVDPAGLLERLQQTLPIGFHAYAVEEVPMKAPALMSALTGFEYDIVVVTNDADSLRGRVEEVLAAEELFAERRAKAGKKKGKRRASPGTKAVNVRPNILSLEVIAAEDGAARLHLKTQTVESRGVKVREVLQLLGVDPAAARVRKTATHLAEEASPAPA